jgi:hypothetical protein
VDEVAAIMPGTGEEDVDYNRDIVLCYKHGHTKFISHIHPLYHPLHYVLLFPKGDQGFTDTTRSFNLKRVLFEASM